MPFLCATWGVFLLEIAVVVVASGSAWSSDDIITLNIVMLAIWLAGLVIAGAMGSKAKKLRTAAGIKWPPR